MDEPVSPARLAEMNAADLKKATYLLVRVKARIDAARERGANGDVWFDQEERIEQAWLMLDAAATAFVEEVR